MPDDVVADAVLLPLSLFGVIKRALICSSPDMKPHCSYSGSASCCGSEQ